MRWYNFLHIYQPPAWDEPIIRRVADESYRPILSILERHPNVSITLNITGALTEQLLALGLHDIPERLRVLVEKKQIELVGGAMYHAFLPLVPSHEARRQIELQQELNQRVYGITQPHGLYLPEMGYSPELDQTILDLGYRWIILDEGCSGKLVGTLPLDRPYTAPSGLKIIFRNRLVSDWMSFQSDLAAPEKSLEEIEKDPRSNATLVTAFDGENLGHHRHGVDALWEFLVTSPRIETGTLSELAAVSTVTPIQPIAGSWSSLPSELAARIPFGLWNHPTNPIHQAQWELTYTVIKAVQAAEHDPYYAAARRLLDRALASDRYWWASAQPWWDLPIIIRETQKLADVVDPLTTLPSRVKNEVERLMQRITTTVNLWERTGLAKRRQTTYLKDSGDVHYLGGAALSK